MVGGRRLGPWVACFAAFGVAASNGVAERQHRSRVVNLGVAPGLREGELWSVARRRG
jgi:hypothetical protein